MRILREVTPSRTCRSEQHPGKSYVVKGQDKILADYEEVDLHPGRYEKVCPDCGESVALICEGPIIR